MADGAGASVLVVEDDALIASFIARALATQKHAVTRLETGREALDRVNAGGVGLVLLDLGLPDIDGLDVLRALRAGGGRPPVVVITSRSDPADRAVAEGLGVSGYIVKPFALADLFAVVAGALGDATASR